MQLSPWPFFLLAIGWSWLFWIASILLGYSLSSKPGIVLLVIGWRGYGLDWLLKMNFAGEFLRLPGDFEHYQYLSLIGMAAGIVADCGPRSFTMAPAAV